jgi:Dyp-type peroxidase family
MADDPILDGSAIQGNIIPGFGRSMQLLVAYNAEGPDVLRRALCLVAPALTALSPVLKRRGERKEVFLGERTFESLDDPLWLNLALGRYALEALGYGEVASLDEAFERGMIAERTGDPREPLLPDGSLDPACPDNWVVGGPNRRVDIFLIFAADSAIEELARPLLEELDEVPGLNRIYREKGESLPGEKEHFGFADGVSLPGPRGVVDVGGVQVQVTTRYGVPPREGVQYGRPGQPLVPPGQFLVGADGDLKPTPEIARDGSFLVFRRLRQDVRGFYEETDNLAAQIAAETGDDSLDGPKLRALFVGRWPSGQPLMRPGHEPPSDPEPFLARNYFAYGAPLPPLNLPDGTSVPGAPRDPDAVFGGSICPAYAHIRKVNPRDLGTDKGGAAETRRFQMLRRGIPFGPSYNHEDPDGQTNEYERGLLFLSYQRSIEDQFETLNSDWMNNEDTPTAGGFDVLVGQNAAGGHHDARAFHYLPAGVAARRYLAMKQWVTPTGGAYLFALSIRAVWAIVKRDTEAT